MGDTPSRPAAAPAGAPTVGGTSLEAALAEIEGERALAANMHPPGVSGPPEIELREVESDEAMARRLQSEEDARGNAAPPAASPAYYPKMPYAVPQPFAPVAHAAPTVGRGLMSDVNSGNGVARRARRGGAFPPPPQPQGPRAGPRSTPSPSEVARPVPYSPYGFQPGFAPPHLAPPEDNADAALARRLQAEEDALDFPPEGRSHRQPLHLALVGLRVHFQLDKSGALRRVGPDLQVLDLGLDRTIVFQLEPLHFGDGLKAIHRVHVDGMHFATHVRRARFDLLHFRDVRRAYDSYGLDLHLRRQ